jgi:hypothetical protein
VAEDEQAEDDILIERAGELGAAGGAIGGSIGASLGGAPGGNVAGAAAGRGGRSGARFAARFLNRTEVHEEAVGVPAGLDPMTRAEEVLRALAGAAERLTGEDGTPTLRGVVGAGWFKLNAAVVTISPASGGRLTVRAAAKEGLIKQHTAEQAVRRVAAELTQPPSPTPPTAD